MEIAKKGYTIRTSVLPEGEQVVEESLAQIEGSVQDIEVPHDTSDLSGADLVLKRLLLAHEVWFDVYRNREVAGRTFPGVAEYHQVGEKYVLIKRAKLWEIASNEYVFFDTVGFLEEGAFEERVSFIKEQALPIMVKPHPNHMFSNLSLVIIADSVAAGLDRVIRKVRFRKNFKWGLWGWSDLRVAVIDLSKGEHGCVITNAAGKNLRKTLEANLAPAAPRQ